jgi:D-arabinose 1-dehydrogenase-like Zn-dependent alcohol dehydrogenase
MIRCMSKMRVVEVQTPKGPLVVAERDVPEPRAGSVRVRVQACGVCHSDALTKEGLWPGLAYPRVPGHEIAGVVDALGDGVQGFRVGDRVGVGWHGGHCGWCEPCRRADFLMCTVAGRIPGITMDGGYEEFLVAQAGTLAAIPDGLSATDAAPLMCAGVTTFNSLRNAGARPGDTVAVLGLGGLGHLAVQFAAKSGFFTIAIARGDDKGTLAKELGAHEYVDSRAGDPGAALKRLGGAHVILATVTAADAMSAVLPGLAAGGKLVVLGAPHDPLSVPAGLLIGGRRAIAGWPSGTSIDSQDTLRFAARFGVKPMNELFPLERAGDAYERMMSGAARFRVVLTTGG